MLVGEAKIRIQNKFEGGHSIDTDWNLVLQEAVEAMLIQINPPTLKRTSALYGGTNEKVSEYYAPRDLYKPIDVRDVRTDQTWRYTRPAQFEQNNIGKFTINYRNGLPFVKIVDVAKNKHSVLDAFESTTNKTGVPLHSNTYHYITGSNALSGNFSDTNTDVIGSVASIDISDFIQGVAIVVAHIPKSFDVDELKLTLKTDVDNYYVISADTSYIVDGWNLIVFDVKNKTTTGAPTLINEYVLTIKMKDGKSQQVTIDNLTLYETSQLNIEYYTNRAFLDSETGKTLVRPLRDEDEILLGTDEAGILVYEGCRVISVEAVKSEAKAREDFTTVLAEKYSQYWKDRPSQEMPMSYNHSIDIDINGYYDS